MDLKQIRLIHNCVKTDIIHDAYVSIPYVIPSPSVCCSVLDLACGRGGDLHKYYHAHFGRVIAVDNHSDSINEATRRYSKTYSSDTMFNVSFVVHDLKQPLEYMNENVDAVVMNFALNYFFDSIDSLKSLFRTISTWLRPDGVFTGIALDGERVIKQPLDTQTYNILPSSDFYDTTSVYNRGYVFSFKETMNDYFDFRGNMTEYLVDMNELDRIAALFGLYPQNHRHFDVDDPVLSMDVVFKYTMPSSYAYINSQRFFPSPMHLKQLQIMPDTESVCSRPQASRLLVNIIENHYKQHIRCIMDATAHVGTDTITLAMHFSFCSIISVEKDDQTAMVLKRNIHKCGFNNVTVLNTDCVDLLRQNLYRPDILYIDAPWGGPMYKSKQTVSLLLNGINIGEIVSSFCSDIPCVILKIPINFDMASFERYVHNKTSTLFPYVVHETLKFNFLMLM